MKNLRTVLFICSIALFFIQNESRAQVYLGGQLAGVDSSPLPNVAILPFLGYSADYDTWFIKYSAGYLQTFIGKNATQTRTVFSGALLNISPEFVFTSDRNNPFKGNLGVSAFYGNYYKEEAIFLPGLSFGFAWGFGDRYTEFEWVGNMHLLYAKDKEGTSKGPFHTMAMMGVLWKI